MYQTLTDLYNGKIQPFSLNPDNDADFRLAYKDYCRNFREISELVGKEHEELLNELANSVMQLTAEQERLLFCEGFRLGMKLAAECFFQTESRMEMISFESRNPSGVRERLPFSML